MPGPKGSRVGVVCTAACDVTPSRDRSRAGVSTRARVYVCVCVGRCICMYCVRHPRAAGACDKCVYFRQLVSPLAFELCFVPTASSFALFRITPIFAFSFFAHKSYCFKCLLVLLCKFMTKRQNQNAPNFITECLQVLLMCHFLA